MTSPESPVDSADTIAPNFSKLGLSKDLCKTISELGYEEPSAIQARAIEPFINGRDILGLAQTGTGKTAAFALPILQKIDLSKTKPQALILTPTRELALQVCEAFQSYSKRIKGFHVMPIYGGQEMRGQLRNLKRTVHVVVGTPGRVMDHMRRKSLQLGDIKTLVLDEADEMLRMGFIDDVEWILQQIPDKRQLALFSATMPSAIARITGKYLNRPEEIRIKSKTKTVEKIAQTYTVVQNNQKLDALTRIFEVEEMDAAILFVRTKGATMELAQKLEARGYASAAINGDLNQKQRENTIAALKNGRIDVLVATDVAARGIDVSRISLVVNYDIPNDPESYVHRIGRTGRAGREGKALLLVTPREKRLLQSIERNIGQSIEYSPIPTNADLVEQRSARFTQKLLESLQSPKLEEMRDYVKEIAKEQNIGVDEIAACLALIAQQDKPLDAQERDSLSRVPQDFGKDGESRKSQRSKQERKAVQENINFEVFKLHVGKADEVGVKDVVGAIANELQIDAEFIGQIRLDDDCTYVELPAEMPKELLSHFKKMRLRGVVCQAEVADQNVDMGKRSERSRPSNRRDSKSRRGNSRGENGNNKGFTSNRRSGGGRPDSKSSRR